MRRSIAAGRLVRSVRRKPLCRAARRALGVPIGPVLVSPLCRTVETPPAGKIYYSPTHKGQMLEEGEAAIVQPHGTSFEEVARLGLKEWRGLEALPR